MLWRISNIEHQMTHSDSKCLYGVSVGMNFVIILDFLKSVLRKVAWTNKIKLMSHDPSLDNRSQLPSTPFETIGLKFRIKFTGHFSFRTAPIPAVAVCCWWFRFFTNSTKSVTVSNFNKMTKQDVLGTFEIRRMTARNQKGTEVNFITKNYQNLDIVVFEQHFLNGVENPGNRYSVMKFSLTLN